MKIKRNRKQSLVTWLAGGVFIAAIAVGGYQLYLNLQAEKVASGVRSPTYSGTQDRPSEAPITNNDKDKHVVAPDEPRFITITKLNISARVLGVGVNKDGRLSAPSNVSDTGWYKQSAKPGTPGAVLIDGHATGLTSKGVFYGLKKLVLGDEIVIERGDGQKITYKISETEAYHKDKLDMAKALQPMDPKKSGLSLITCTGKFNASQNEYEERLLVRAVQS